jgi:integrase
MFKRIVSLIEINCPNLKEGWRSNHRKNPPLGSPKEAVYLTVEEIQRLASLEGLDERREAVRNQFLVGCLTGARYSDFIVLKKENIFDGYLTYISQKTKIRSKVPVSPLLEKLIIGCSGLTCDIPLMSFERDIKELCRIAQIQTVVQVCDESGVRLSPKFELVTSHTARRSFCRNLAMYNTPIMTIRDLAGHTNIAMTERYIGRNIELIPGKTMMDYFESFS